MEWLGLFCCSKLWTRVSPQPALQPELHAWLHGMVFEGPHCPCFWEARLLTVYCLWLKSTLSYISCCFFTVPIYFLPSFHVSPGLPQETIHLFSVKALPKEKEQDFSVFWCVLAKLFITTEQKLAFLEKNDSSRVTTFLICCNRISQYNFKAI